MHVVFNPTILILFGFFHWVRYASWWTGHPALSFDSNNTQLNTLKYPTGRNFSLEFKFHYFANGKFAKFKFRLSLDFQNIATIANQKSKFAKIKFCEFDHVTL